MMGINLILLAADPNVGSRYMLCMGPMPLPGCHNLSEDELRSYVAENLTDDDQYQWSMSLDEILRIAHAPFN